MERDTDRFYNYPPILPSIKAEEIFQKTEIGLYIHIPYCERICYFCPYNKYPKNDEQIRDYLIALKKEMHLLKEQPIVRNSIIKVIFVGGGTPTCLSPGQLTELMNLIKENFMLTKDCSITVEGTPSSVDEKKLEALKKAGVNRISIGVQTFNDEKLRQLGRSHDAKAAFRAVELIRKAGFDDFNIDLMYRLPNQTIEDWRKDLEIFGRSGATHLSTYALDVVPGTAFFYKKKQGKLDARPDFETEKQMFRDAEQILKKYGFVRYNVDFLCKDNKKNKYGLAVVNTDILGLGAGAFSHFNGFEFKNCNKPTDYINSLNEGKLPIETGKKLTKREQLERYAIKKIQYLEIDKKEFLKKFGISLQEVFSDRIKNLIKEGFIEDSDDKLVLTELGKLYIYNVCKEFYDPEYLKIIEQIKKIEVQND